jgi:protein-S-isoprenylcysteine O-methyltransferase Ste14
MLPLIFTDKVAGGLSLAAYAVWMSVEYWLIVRERGQVHDRQDQGSKRVLILACWIALLLCVTLAIVVRSATFPGNPWIPVAIGVVMVLFGAWLRVWSVRTLGRFFRRTVMVQGAHRVIQEGPYKYIRHPSYTGFLLSAVGIGLLFGNWLGLIVLTVIVFLAFLQRIVLEEAVLARELGEPYQTYMKRSSRLIPFIY